MRLIRRIWYLLRQRSEARELAEEMELHRAMVEDARRAEGASAEEARAAAQRAMGNSTLALENARWVWLAPWLESVTQDLRYAVRSLRSQPTFTFMALLALVPGLGLNTSLFTAINAAMFRPWDIPEPEGLVSIYADRGRFGVGGFALPGARFLNEHGQTIEGAFAARDYTMRLEDGSGPAVRGEIVSGNFFEILRSRAAMGRTFDPDEDVIGAPHAVAVISDFLWKDAFAADPAIIGGSVRLDGAPFTVIGVMGESFTGIDEDYRTDIWIPFASYAVLVANAPDRVALLTDPGRCCVEVGARLKPGVSRDQAEAELNGLYQQYETQVRSTFRSSELRLSMAPARVVVAGTAPLQHPDRWRRMAPIVAVITAAFALVLLLACANVSNLLLARASERQREIAVRVAIGGGRARIVRQLLTESLLLAGIASGSGLVLALVLPRLILRYVGQHEPNLTFTPDLNVVAYAVGIAGVATVAFGLAPALRGTRISLSEAMKRQSAQASSRAPVRSVLLGVQVAISVALLIGAGLLIRGVSRARSMDLGFRTEGVAAIQVSLPANAYDTPREIAFFDDLTARLSAGGHPAGVTLSAPLGGNRTPMDLGESCGRAQALVQSVSPGFFDVLEIPVSAGRSFRPEDIAAGSILVNETLARTCWPGRSPLGARLRIRGREREVVGVTRDAQLDAIGALEPTYFEPFAQSGRPPAGAAILLIPSEMTASALGFVRAMDAGASAQVMRMEERLDRFLGNTTSAARLAGALGLLALLLATVGIYGVISYSVQQHRREIGVRIALGAGRAQVVGLVLWRNVPAVCVGLGAGLAVAAGESVVLRSQLYGLNPADPLAYAGVLAVLLLSAAAASAIPAHRAARTDPVTVLHDG